MTNTDSRLRRVLVDLGLALLNATLILVAVCLFFAWRTARTVDGIAETLVSNIEIVEPLRNDVNALTSEVTALREDLATITSQTGNLTSESAAALEAKIAAFDARIDGVQTKVETARQRIGTALADPDALIEQAIRTATDQAARNMADFAGCALPTPPTPGSTVAAPPPN
ncbi:hypothetical protein [Tropicimonas marinistellae]|uniref:hypothetical protein n=1 Tax=Tropicimonas marinistellae TaxID=1739787 RepID=UPI000829687F|nr:hypothetical protein [Tropicimonas marinistellae]